MAGMSRWLTSCSRRTSGRADMLEAFQGIDRYIVLTRVAAEGRLSVYVFVNSTVRPDDSLATFALDDDYSFGILSSSLNRKRFDERCSKLKVDPRYTSTTVWDSFPWPSNPTDDAVAQVASATKAIIDLRQKYQAEGIPWRECTTPFGTLVNRSCARPTKR